jgi:hypothetical protein
MVRDFLSRSDVFRWIPSVPRSGRANVAPHPRDFHASHAEKERVAAQPVEVRRKGPAPDVRHRVLHDGGKISGQPVTNAITANGNTEYTRESASSFIFIQGSSA